MTEDEFKAASVRIRTQADNITPESGKIVHALLLIARVLQDGLTDVETMLHKIYCEMPDREERRGRR